MSAGFPMIDSRMSRHSAPPDLSECKDVLVVKPGSMGDIVHTLPAVHDLRTAFPGTRFHWVVNTGWLPLLEDNADLASVLPFPRQRLRGLKALPGFVSWCLNARPGQAGRADLAIDFQGLLRSVLIARGLGAARIAGMDDAREGSRWFQKHTVAVGGAGHAVERYRKLAAALGADVSGAPVFPLPEGVLPAGLPPGDVHGAVVVHASSRGKDKTLPGPVLDKLVAALASRRVVLVGQTKEEIDAKSSAAGGFDWRNQTSIAELIAILRRAACVVSVDSGPMHLAAAIGVPVLGLHTWSDPRKVGPWGETSSVWKNGRLVAVPKMDHDNPEWSGPGEWTDALPDQVAAWVAGH